MAIYGIGAFQGQSRDVTQDFISRGIAGTDWPEADAPSIHTLLRHMKLGDVIYIKSFVRNVPELRIKAVGIVTDNRLRNRAGVGRTLSVRWVWRDPENPHRVADPGDPTFNTRSQTLYEEHNPIIARAVLRLLLARLAPKRLTLV